MTRVYELFLRGGFLMWPLLALSLAAVAIAIERALCLWRQDAAAEATADALTCAWRDGGATALEERVQTLSQSTAELAGVALHHAGDRREQLIEAVEIAGKAIVSRLEGPLDGLRAIAEVAPLVGFLGTVLGMISAFDNIVAQGTGDPRVVAGGISVALLTTAGGLMVAIPAFLAHSLLSARLDRVAETLERAGHVLVMLLAEGDQTP